MPDTYTLIMDGKHDRSIRYDSICNELKKKGFSERIKGTSHRIYYKDGVSEIINIQPNGGKEKAYQVKQIRDIFRKYGI